MNSRILLCTSVAWPYAARLVSAFAQAGARVEALFPRQHPMRFSRHLSGRHSYNALMPLESLRRAIAASAPDLIIACDDRTTAQLLQLHDEAEHSALRDVIARSLGNPSAYRNLASRHAFIAMARDIGAIAPPTMAIAGQSDLEMALEILGLPLVLKVDESWGGDGVMMAQSAQEAYDALRRINLRSNPLHAMARAMKRRDVHFLQAARGMVPGISAQAFIAGRPATSSFACWRGEIVGINHFDVIETCGTTGPASVVRRVDCPWMEDAARRIARHFGLSGLHGLDFMRDEADVAHLIEINPRATPTSYMALGLDHDPTAALLTAALGHPAAPRAAATMNETIALFPQEWRRDSESRYLSSAFHDAPWDDPAVLRASLGPLDGKPVPTRRQAQIVNAGVTSR